MAKLILMMWRSQIQPLLIPEIELSAVNPLTNQTVLTVLSSDEASFVTGVFSEAGATPITPGAAASASATANSVAPFVLPGVSIGITPVGLFVTMGWVGLFLGFTGLGTARRVQSRERHRRRMRWEMSRAVKTI